MRLLNSLQLSISRFLVLAALLSACQPAVIGPQVAAPQFAAPQAGAQVEQSADVQAAQPTATVGEAFATLTPTAQPEQTKTPTDTVPADKVPDSLPTATPTESQADPTEAASPTPTSALVESHALPAVDWKSWPVIPQVPVDVIAIYQRGLALGNDPHAFSILGDCQSLAETFLGVYDTDPARVAALPADLQAVVGQFSGSFDRQSPTVKGGTTAGAVLWSAWHENEYTCGANESPLACELRLHKPSIVIINLGTHYETRNIIYLRKILDQLIEAGVVPVLSTKADNREMDDRLNLEMAQLAVEYNLPMWNFYAAVSDLPNHGVGIKAGDEHLGEIYLNEEGLERHRYTALQALEAVWSALQQP